MIKENNASIFQFGNTDEFQEPILQEERKEIKLEKLSNRVTLLTILIPFMIGTILVIAYLDIKNRVTLTHNTEATSIERVSKDLENKFSLLSLELAKIKDIHSNKIPSLEKSIAILQSDREEMSRAMEYLSGKNQEMSESMMAESDNMLTEIEAIKSIGDQMGKDLEDVSNNLYALSENVTGIKDGLHKLNTDISKISAEKIGKKDLDLALKLKEMSNRQALLEVKATLDKKIDNLNSKQKNIQSSQSEIVAVQTIKGSKRSKEKPSRPENNPAVLPGADGIVEQTIE